MCGLVWTSNAIDFECKKNKIWKNTGNRHINSIE